jgi:hypothetical protein
MQSTTWVLPRWTSLSHAWLVSRRCSGCREHVCFACGKKMPRANPYSHFHGGRCSQSSPAPRTAAGGEAGGAAGVQGLAQLAVALAAADRARAAANAAMQVCILSTYMHSPAVGLS